MDEIKDEAKPEEVKEMVLTITIKQDGNVSVNGPLFQKPICLYMLELAKDVVKLYNPNKVIVPQKGGIFNFARKRFS